MPVGDGLEGRVLALEIRVDQTAADASAARALAAGADEEVSELKPAVRANLSLIVALQETMSDTRREMAAGFAEMRAGFAAMARGFEAMECGFADHDGRFADHDARFDGVDRRLDRMDQRFDGIERRLDRASGDG